MPCKFPAVCAVAPAQLSDTHCVEALRFCYRSARATPWLSTHPSLFVPLLNSPALVPSPWHLAFLL